MKQKIFTEELRVAIKPETKKALELLKRKKSINPSDLIRRLIENYINKEVKIA